MNKNIFKIDPKNKLPLYDQIQRNLRELIIDKQLNEGETMPSEWELANLYGVSRLTVRRAMDDLVRQNWLSRRQGVGTFITRPSVASISPAMLSFTEEMLAIGRIPSSQLIENRVVLVNVRIANFLHLQEGDPVIQITRLRYADGVPILLETAYLPQARFPKLETEQSLTTEPLYAYLKEHYNISITGMDQTLKPVLLSTEQSHLLEVEPGSPAIASECVAFSSEGKPEEYSWSVASGEKSEFYFRFRRGETIVRTRSTKQEVVIKSDKKQKINN